MWGQGVKPSASFGSSNTGPSNPSALSRSVELKLRWVCPWICPLRFLRGLARFSQGL